MINDTLLQLLSLQELYILAPLISIVFWAHGCVVFFCTSVMYLVAKRGLSLARSHSLSVIERERDFDNIVEFKVKDLFSYKKRDLEKEHDEKLKVLIEREAALKRELDQMYLVWQKEAQKDISRRESDLEKEKQVVKQAQAMKSKYENLLGSSWVYVDQWEGARSLNWHQIYDYLIFRIVTADCGNFQYCASVTLTGGYKQNFAAQEKGIGSLIKEVEKYKKRIGTSNAFHTGISINVWARSMPQ